MKNQNTIFIKTVCIATFLLCSTLLLCCNNDPEKTDAESIVIKTDSLPIQQAKWLLGTWENNSKDGRTTEKWEQLNDSVFTGVSYILNVADTVFFEYIKLEQKGNQLLFIPTVKNQNNEQPVIFTSTSINNTEMVFENRTHDFPQKISYRKVAEDSAIAEISAMLNGKEKKELFPMKKMN